MYTFIGTSDAVGNQTTHRPHPEFTVLHIIPKQTGTVALEPLPVRIITSGGPIMWSLPNLVGQEVRNDIGVRMNSVMRGSQLIVLA